MRNLKKILALVLALVMSLSLMATAGAAETTAAANDYTIASTVLQGLGVVRGDENGIRETDPITRAEVAALAYRVHTADVKDEKANLYYDLKEAAFSDLAPVQAWALGYIGYAHNAQIVKGNGDGTFNPTGNITGYEVLAMTLRAIGYGKNGEFEGAEWQINTAAWARREGLLEGVSPADQTSLDKPATRGMVFQVLLNAVLHNDVQFSYVTPDLYVEADTSMAKRLHLEVETGVVIANEWAALDAGSPLAANKVKVEVTDGTTRTLNWSADTKETGADYATGLKDIGKSRTIYMQDAKVLYLADTGKNVVKDNDGKKNTVNDLKDGLTVNDSTKHFINFADIDKVTSDMRIEIRLSIAPSAIGDDPLQFQVAEKVIADALGESKTAASSGRLTYVKVIPAGTELKSSQITVMKEIFRVADDINDTDFIKGEIFVGTKSSNDSDDVSNSISWSKFDADYLKHDKGTVSSTGNGNWLQVVDNDSDGVAEYVLLVEYDLDTIVENKNDKFYYRDLNLDNYAPVEVEGYTQTVGDIVLYAKIDGKAYVHKADTATATFKAVNYKERTATPTEGDPYEQSDIDNYTTLPGDLTAVDELTSYTLYLDDYGFVRAYDNKVSYALLTEMYPTTDWNSAWIVNRELTAEAMLAGDTAVREYKVLNSTYNGANNPFFTGVNGGWSYPGITNIRYNTYQYEDKLNYLQPATHMLDVTAKQGFVFDYSLTDLYVKDGSYDDVDANGNRLWPNFNTKSWTNVAKYTQTSDGLNLYTAAGTSNNVTTDYIRLNSDVTALKTINKNNPLFTIQDQFYDEVYTSANNHYVRAVDNTVFYLVTVNKNGTTQAIRQYTGYSNVPTLNDENNVRSMYAVAHTNTPNDVNVNANNYWVADVIVIEMYDYNAFESISLIYSNDYKNQGDVKYVEAIDSIKGEIRIIPNNYNVWNGRFEGYGFYGLNNIVAVEGETNTYTADITRITDNTKTDDLGWYESAVTATNGREINKYNKYGIYYGQVRSLWSEDGLSNYITLDVLDQNGLVVDTKDVRVTLGAWGIKDNKTYNSAVPLLLKSTTVNNKVEIGDEVIWVETSSTGTARTAGFLIDLTDTYENQWVVGTSNRSWNPTPDFLWTEAARLGRGQYTGKDMDSAYTYEEIIGKRNDQSNPAAKPVVAHPQENVDFSELLYANGRPQDGFVVDYYELSVYNRATGEYEPVKAIYSDENNTDGLWHLRYMIDAGSIVRVRVDRNDLMRKDLVLNSSKSAVASSKYNGNIMTSAGTGIDVFGYTSWTFVMPEPGTGKVVVGTIFEDTTTIPAYTVYPTNESSAEVDRLFTDGSVAHAYLLAVEELNEAADNEIAKIKARTDLTDAEKVVEIAKINTKLANALAAVKAEAVHSWNINNAPAQVDKIEAEKNKGYKDITGTEYPAPVEDVTVTFVTANADVKLDPESDEIVESATVKAGESLTFYVEYDAETYPELSVTDANGEELAANDDGSYTIESVDADMEINVTASEEIIDDEYTTVTFVVEGDDENAAVLVEGEATESVTIPAEQENKTVTFTVDYDAENYELDSVIAVTYDEDGNENSEELTADEETGAYSVDASVDVTVTVTTSAIETKNETVTVTIVNVFEGEEVPEEPVEMAIDGNRVLTLNATADLGLSQGDGYTVWIDGEEPELLEDDGEGNYTYTVPAGVTEVTVLIVVDETNEGGDDNQGGDEEGKLEPLSASNSRGRALAEGMTEIKLGVNVLKGKVPSRILCAPKASIQVLNADLSDAYLHTVKEDSTCDLWAVTFLVAEGYDYNNATIKVIGAKEEPPVDVPFTVTVNGEEATLPAEAVTVYVDGHEFGTDIKSIVAGETITVEAGEGYKLVSATINEAEIPEEGYEVTAEDAELALVVVTEKNDNPNPPETVTIKVVDAEGTELTDAEWGALISISVDGEKIETVANPFSATAKITAEAYNPDEYEASVASEAVDGVITITVTKKATPAEKVALTITGNELKGIKVMQGENDVTEATEITKGVDIVITMNEELEGKKVTYSINGGEPCNEGQTYPVEKDVTIVVTVEDTTAGIPVSITVTGNTEAAEIKVTDIAGKEIKNGDKVAVGEKLTVTVTSKVAGQVIEATFKGDDAPAKNGVKEYFVTKDLTALEIKVAVAAKKWQAAVEVLNEEGKAYTGVVTVKVDGKVYDPKTSVVEKDSVITFETSNQTKVVTVKVGETNVELTGEEGKAKTGKYNVTGSEGEKVTVTISEKDMAAIGVGFTADTDVADVKVDKQTVSADGTTTKANVAPGKAFTLTGKLGTAPKGQYVIVETKGAKTANQIWGVKVGENKEFSFTLPAVEEDTTYVLYTHTGELAAKKEYKPAAPFTVTVDNSDIAGGSAYATLTSVEVGTSFETLAGYFFAQDGQNVTFKSAKYISGYPCTTPNVPTNTDDDGLGEFTVTVGEEEIVVLCARKAPVNVRYHGEIVDKVVPGSDQEVELKDMAGAHYTIKVGEDFYKVNETTNALVKVASPDGTAEICDVDAETKSISFKVSATEVKEGQTVTASPITTGDIIITDGLYKVTPIGTNGSAATATYKAEGDSIGVEKYAGTTGVWFKMTTGTGDTTKYYNADGVEQKGAYFFTLTANGDNKDLVVKMPAAENVTITSGYHKVTAADEDTFKTVFTAAKVDGINVVLTSDATIAYVKDGTEIGIPSDDTYSVLMTTNAATPEMKLVANGDKTDPKVAVKADCSVETAKFVEIKVSVSGTAGARYTVADTDGKINLHDFVVDTLKAGEDTYVTVDFTATGKATEAAPQKLDATGNALTPWADEDGESAKYMLVSDLKNVKVDAAELNKENSLLSTGFVKLTIDATAFGRDTATYLVEGDEDATPITKETKNDVFLVAGKGVRITVSEFDVKYTTVNTEPVNVNGTYSDLVNGSTTWTLVLKTTTDTPSTPETPDETPETPVETPDETPSTPVEGTSTPVEGTNTTVVTTVG